MRFNGGAMDDVTQGQTQPSDEAPMAGEVPANGSSVADATVATKAQEEAQEEAQVEATATVAVAAPIEAETMPLPAGRPAAEPAPPHVRYAVGAAPVGAAEAPSGHGWLSPTLNLERPNGDSATDGVDHAPAVPSHRPRWWIAVAVAIVLIIGGILAIVLVQGHRSSPTDSVRAYFAALASDDTTTALALVENANNFPASADPLLTPAALARVADRPTGVTITGTGASTAGRKTTVVSVAYTVGGTTVHQTIDVVANSATAAGASKPYLLTAPFITVSVPDTGGRAVSVNGIPVAAGVAHTLAFPATYVATVAGNPLISAATAPAAYHGTSGTIAADITLPAPTVAPGATPLVQAAVNSALDKCAASRSPAPPNCPFSYSDSSATLTWKIVTYPTVSVALIDGVVTFTDNGHPAGMHYDASTSFLFGLIPHTDSGSRNTDVTGTAAAAGTGISVTFTRQ